MKLERFTKNKNYKKALLVILVAIILLGGGILIYRTFAFYETSKVYNVLEGTIGRFQTGGNDIILKVKIDDEDVETFPIKGGYKVKNIECTNGAKGTWNNETWGIEVGNIETNTTCTVYFETYNALTTFEDIDFLANVTTNTCSKPGITKINHEKANIIDAGYSALEKPLTFSDVEKNLKQTEYRYCGPDPNNYVTFNGEVAGWQIIGLVNTPEGSRIKLIRTNPLSERRAWDKNSKNDWNDASLKKYLNGENDEDKFNLTEDTQNMIDTITWNLGGYSDRDITADQFYNYERGNTTYEKHPTLWQGKIALLYPSDSGYATGIESCMNNLLHADNCQSENWILKETLYSNWLLMPRTNNSYDAYVLGTNGLIWHDGLVRLEDDVRPVLYLKPKVDIASGTGTAEDPYILK